MVVTPHPAVESSRPLVFAHRGGSKLGPENTIAAFDRGLASGADGLELDVHLSRDGVVVVHHDATLDRTTDATGPLSARTASELAQVDAAFRFDPAGGFPLRGTGLGIPTLREVLERYRAVPIIVELKVNSAALAHGTLDVIRSAGAIDRIALGSYQRHVLNVARDAEPQIPTGAAREETRLALYKSWVGWPIRGRYRVFQVPEAAGTTRIISPRFIRAAHRAGRPVHVWTVDREEDMRRLLSWGADGIISDRPDIATRVVLEWITRGA